MKVVVKVTALNVDPEKWAENNNGPWPEDDKRSLATAVRNDVKSYLRNLVQNGTAIFEELDIEVEVQ